MGAEYRHLSRIPKGPLLVASKHQSLWETFALLLLLPDPAYIMKRELMWIPFFGWYTWKAGMIPVDRGRGAQALADMNACVRRELARGRQIIIFPEGTRRPPGAEPRYKYGVVHLYAEAGVACLPIALNSGLFWPRRSIRRNPGTIRVEVLPPIPPGLDKEEFFTRLQQAIEPATAQLVSEGERELGRKGSMLLRSPPHRELRLGGAMRSAGAALIAPTHETRLHELPSAVAPGDAGRSPGSRAPRRAATVAIT